MDLLIPFQQNVKVYKNVLVHKNNNLSESQNENYNGNYKSITGDRFASNIKLRQNLH